MACEHNCAICTPEIREYEFITNREKLKTEKNDFIYDFNIHSKPTTIMLGVTNSCNLSCSYCFVDQCNCAHMDLKTAFQATEWVKKNAKEKNEKPNINFFGGEPLLQFNELIKPLIEQYHSEINFGITTNGVLLTEDIVDFFKKYNVNILLSFDGVPEVQNEQRSNSFKVVMKNIPYLLLRFPNTVMRSTITKQSIPYIYDSVLMAEKLGFKSIVMCPNGYEEWDKDDENELEKQLLKVGQYIYEGFFSNEKDYYPISVDPLTKYYKFICQSTEGKLGFYNGVMRCGLGTTTCGIAPNGDIVPCQEKTSKNEANIGNVFTGIDAIKHEKYLNQYLNAINNITCNKGCNDKDRLYCLTNFCPSRFEDLNYRHSSAECAFNRISTKIASRLHFLCADSCHMNIHSYFESEENNLC